MTTARVLRMEESTSLSGVRRRFDLGGNSTSTTQPKIIPFRAGENERPTLPVPRPPVSPGVTLGISLGAVPRRLVDDKALMGLPIDHRAAFLLLNIDGKTPVRALVDITCLPPDEVLALLERLLELEAIALP